MKIKSYKLKRGDRVAILAPSSGKAKKFPGVYREGIKNIEDIFGLNVVEYPTTKMDDEQLYNNPELRAKDINNAFADTSIRGIITTIGGDDSVRILPFLNKKLIEKNPKLFMGYSDASILLAFLNQLGLIAFHGPSVMAGFAQTKNLPKAFEDHIKNLLFSDFKTLKYSPFQKYCDGYKNWKLPKTKGAINKLKENDDWNWINGLDEVSGELFGGCIEALEFIKSTIYWPQKNFWYGKILFLETSEEKPKLEQVKRMLRNYGTQGVFNKISALLFGRPNFYTKTEKKGLEKTILNVVIGEFKATKLPIITNMDFGHTDPQLILPLGMKIRIDCSAKTVILIND